MTNAQQPADSNTNVEAAATQPTNSAIEPTAGHDPIDAAEIVLDTPAQIDAALVKQQADWAAQFLQETGHPDVKSLLAAHQQEKAQSEELASRYKGQYEQAQIKYAILAESSDAVSPTFIQEFLAPKAVCDDNGKVTIDGKPIAQAVKALLDANPFLAKAQGGTGSGAPQHTAVVKEMTRDQFDRMQPNERRKFLNDGGKIIG